MDQNKNEKNHRKFQANYQNARLCLIEAIRLHIKIYELVKI